MQHLQHVAEMCTCCALHHAAGVDVLYSAYRSFYSSLLNDKEFRCVGTCMSARPACSSPSVAVSERKHHAMHGQHVVCRTCCQKRWPLQDVTSASPVASGL
jgi:hypothetical protein